MAKLTEDQESWINDLALNVDILGSSYCGYWARGIDFNRKLGWLVYDSLNRDRMPSTTEIEEAKRAWRNGLPLPADWIRWDRGLAEKALAAGERKYGEDFSTEYDSSTADVAMQLAIFGKVLYG